MRDIKKAGFYKNWFEIANSLEDKDERLNFYEMIFNYYFLEIEPGEELTLLLKTLFLAVKANIDADLTRKNGGAPVGNNNATKKQPKTTSLFLVENNPETNKVEVKVNDKDNVNEKVEVKVTDTLPTTFQPIIKIINTFAEENGFNFGKKTISELANSLSITTDPKQNLNEQLEFVKSKYPNKTGDELAKLFIASLHWERKETAKKVTKTRKPLPPKICTFCGASLIPGGMINTVECPSCQKSGVRTWWELEQNVWKCNR